VIARLISLGLAVIPLALDTFAIAAVVGASRPTGWIRARISVIFVLFEGGMPLVGLALGRSLGQTIGSLADYASGGLLIALAGYLRWVESDDDDEDGAEGEKANARRLSTARGLALLGLGLSISLDELAIGFSVGLGSPHSAPPTQVAILITLILIQTLLVSQLALSLGTRISPWLRERVEALTSPGLAILGGYQLIGQLLHTRILTPPATVILTTVLDIVIVTAVLGIPVTLIASHVRRDLSSTATTQTLGEAFGIASGGSSTSPISSWPDSPTTRPSLDDLTTQSFTRAS
jgi:manganese efflux pump family protein